MAAVVGKCVSLDMLCWWTCNYFGKMKILMLIHLFAVCIYGEMEYSCSCYCVLYKYNTQLSKSS